MLRSIYSVIIFLMISSLFKTGTAEELLNFFDSKRGRSIPVAVYQNKESNIKNTKSLVALISHGHTIKYTEYSFIAIQLASLGYFVISIQHDLDSDPASPKTGSLFEQRRPSWEHGAQNITFIISELKRTRSDLNLDKVILIGHSGGGDISMLFTAKYPERVSNVISLDSLRYPFPTTNHIPILSIRANDTKADDGVLPKSGATITLLKEAKHIDLCDRGTDTIKKKIVNLILNFLKN